MNIPKIIEAIGGIDDKYLKEAELPEKRRFRFKPTLLAAIIVIVALSTGAAALNYTDYAAVYKKATQILSSCFNSQISAKTDKYPAENGKESSADAGNSALIYEDESTESAVAISYISYTSGLDKMKYSLDRRSGLQNESPFTEEETMPEFADLTPVRYADYNYFYNEYGEEIPDPALFPWLENLEEYGVEIENEGEFMTGDFRATAIMCDDHYLWAVVQYALPEKAKKALEDIPDDAYLSFKYYNIEPSAAYTNIVPISLEGDVFTFSVYSRGYGSMPDAVEISLNGFGYISPESNWEFVPLWAAKGNITIPSDKLKKMDNRISNTIKCPTKYGDVDISAQLSPFGIMFKLTSENSKASKIANNPTGIDLNNLRIHLDDGRIYGSGETYFALYYILDGKSGFLENYDDTDPTNDIYYISFPFANAVDIQKIEKLSFDGYELVFED